MVTPAKTSSRTVRRFRRNFSAMLGLGLFVLLIVLALFGPFFTADPLAQALSIKLEPPSAQHFLGTDQ
ncbi:MAG: D,D-dipeptide ABC transporter permease, partial [Thermaceae bacterium]|nr:D,D-dipeptide ABC transporter permease [Thermaceae bacterium]